ncbi:MAG TPA: protein translocase subunit SecD [Microbacteriaceae bacterium]|nr:protein translocase subunit SecD [Microbacteriaceae bacterium]
MAATPSVRKARKSLLALVIIIAAIAGLIGIGVARGETGWTPKLALDLQGGTQILLAPKQADGTQVTGEQLDQAVSIIRQRVDASGVAEAEITTQGNQNIVVSIPGKADEATLARIEASAKMDMRAVLLIGPAEMLPIEDAEEAESLDGVEEVESLDGVADAETSENSDDPQDTQTDVEAEDETDSPVDLGPIHPEPLPTSPSDPAWLTPALLNEFQNFSCNADLSLLNVDAPLDKPLITCDVSKTLKYILSPVEEDAQGNILSGESIADAEAVQETTESGATTNQWAVQLKLNDNGTKLFGQMSTRLFGASAPMDQFAFVLDGSVLIAPTMQAQIFNGRPSITGGYTQETSMLLADQLKFGALPIGFTVQSQDDISATLGTNQLQAGLLAGLIGFLLVMIYSLFQYRVLGSVTIASLVIAGIVTYLLLVLMSWRQGYRLSLAGVAGVMVAVGFTADSFIVYFERIRDELRDGRYLSEAVDAGWKRAIRTILASDGINLLAAIILFVLAVGNVQGFAFTLGLTTIVDVLIVTLFTHPLLVLLSQTKFYRSGHRLSGLDPQQLGAVYRGRAQFKVPEVVTGTPSGKKVSKSRKEAVRRQTIAERKALEAAGQTDTKSGETK